MAVGTLVLRRHTDGDDVWLTVETADPEIHVNDAILEDIERCRDTGYIPGCRLIRTAGETGYRGALLHLDARDRHVVYRVSEFDEATGYWIARWPD
jgi:hypothetical protein